jgi:ParB family transcriptional regulator, chromosome partitioning protein
MILPREVAMPQLTTKPLTWLRPDPKQPRKSFEEAELLALGQSLKVRQLQPVLALPDGTLIAGERRWRAAGIVGLDKLDVIVTDKPLSETEIRVIQLTENLHRADLSGHEKWLACAELMCGNPAWQLKDLAAHLKIAESTVTKYLSPSKCIPAVQQALQEGRIGITECYTLSLLSADEQAQMLALKLAGASRQGLEAASRRQRNSHAAVVRVDRVRLALPGGIQLLATGKGIDLGSLADALSEAQKEVRKARDQNLDVKVMQAVLRKKSGKAGSTHV